MSELAIDGRIEVVVQLLTHLAAGDLEARGIPSDTADDLDAIIVGVNMLAEELQASRDELEDRVRARTAELEELNHDISRLTELGNMLQACETVNTAFEVIKEYVPRMFDGLSGGVYLYRASRNILELKMFWGDARVNATLDPTDCWALRRGQTHFVDAAGPSLPCRHLPDGTRNSICMPMSAHSEISGVLYLTDEPLVPEAPSSASRLTPAKRSLGLAVSEQAAMALANLELRETLKLQAHRDPLTGLLNRRFVEEWVDKEVGRTDLSGRSFGVIMADIDHFKQINDVHGHEAGDSLLKGVADAIRLSLRAGDLPCRYGGEEFLVMLADIDLAVLSERANEVRTRVSEVRVDHRGALLPGVTLSAGIALYPENGASAASVIHAADAALYAAKRNGRNQVVVASGSAL